MSEELTERPSGPGPPAIIADAGDRAVPELPPILLGRATPEGARQVENFYNSVAEIFERWVARRPSKHTRRAYRGDVLAFVEYLDLRWPEDATGLLTTSVTDVHDFRDLMVQRGMAPKTINRRIASLSSFYKYLQGVASEFRLPITVPNPAHAQFIPRGSSDPRDRWGRAEGQAVRLHPPFYPGDDGDAPARRRGRHHQGEGPA